MGSETKKEPAAPVHVGVIVDGNRRWARERNLSALLGHAKGYEKLKEAPAWFFSRGVKILSVYAFSTENWNRSREEVNHLMKLLERAFREDLEEFHDKGYRLAISGRTEELPGDLPEVCLEAINKTRMNAVGTLNICLNYGGRAEIVDAVKQMMKNKLTIEQVHEGMIRKYLYNSDLPDPDLIIRTSGEERLSGFMLWRAAYSELLFMKKYWPDFEEADAESALREYAARQRRFGGG